MKYATSFLLIIAPTAFADGDDVVLFDFETPADINAWVAPDDLAVKEPNAKIEPAAENATSGKHSLKVIFDGGRWPRIRTTRIPTNFDAFHSFHADVTVSRPCVVGFEILQENSKRGGDWDGAVSRWTKTAILRPGKHTLSADLHPNGWSSVRAKLENGRELGKVVALEFFVYSPEKGETVFIDNIRISTKKEKSAAPVKTLFRVLGSDESVSGVQELGKRLKDKWTKPVEKTVEQVEADIQTLYAEIKMAKPNAVLVELRDGSMGYDRTDPSKVFSGWKDAYWTSHGPDGMTLERSTTFGTHAGQEIFMRHRSPLMRVDLSSIPDGAEILAAKLLIVRNTNKYGKDNHPHQPTMWVAEACNRPWEETEVNAYEYARGKFWNAIGGMHWEGTDPDFLPVYLAHGPSQGKTNVWDFTNAVRWWTDGKHPNHGFMLHGDSKDWIQAHYRESVNIKNRPALWVIYEPRL